MRHSIIQRGYKERDTGGENVSTEKDSMLRVKLTQRQLKLGCLTIRMEMPSYVVM